MDEIRRAILRARRITRVALAEARDGARPVGWTDAHERALRRVVKKQMINRILGRLWSRSRAWDEISAAYRRIENG